VVKMLQGVPPRRRYRSVFASESPSAATKDRKAKQQTLGASGKDRQDDDHAPGNSLKGRTKLEQARSDTAASPKIMVLADWTTGLS
jgi:hypothetical protein